MRTDTIAAIASGMTPSGIGIVRISGDEAISAAEKAVTLHEGKMLSEIPTHSVRYGYVTDPSGGSEIIDEVMVLVMRAPKTYTREDTVEIDCHGGITAMKRVLDVILKCGARLAEPGEFTRRAFMNGRIDLSQAEAVADIINAKSELALNSGIRQLRGNVAAKIRELRNGILSVTAEIEAALDDPEHFGEIDFGSRIRPSIEGYLTEVEHLIDTAGSGRFISQGIRTVICGKPNAGKSTLLNALLGEERAIVTDVPGTTRDTLEETLSIEGITLRIIDTAGRHNTKDPVEKIGVDKAVRSIENADLVLFVADGSSPLEEDDRNILELIKNRRTIILLNKSDLVQQTGTEELARCSSAPVIEISASSGSGLEALTLKIKEMFFGGMLSSDDEVVITNMRHKEALEHARESLESVLESIDAGMPEDFFSIDLTAAYQELGYILGESMDEDVIDRIFSDFCMGK